VTAQIAKTALLILVGKDSDIITLRTIHEEEIDALLRHNSITNDIVRMTEMPSELLSEAVVLINAAKRLVNPDMAIVQVIIFLQPI